MSKQTLPSATALEVARQFVTVTPQRDRYLVAVGEGKVNDPIYELYNTERSANSTAFDLVVALALDINAYAMLAVERETAPLHNHISKQGIANDNLQKRVFDMQFEISKMKDETEKAVEARVRQIVERLNARKQTAAISESYARNDLRLQGAMRCEAQVEAYDIAIAIAKGEDA